MVTSINIRYIAALPMWLELGNSLCLIAENVTLPRHLTNGGGWPLSRTSLAVILLDGLSVPATNSSPAILCVLLLACPSASRISSMTILLHSPRKSRSRTWARVLCEKLPSCARDMCKSHLRILAIEGTTIHGSDRSLAVSARRDWIYLAAVVSAG